MAVEYKQEELNLSESEKEEKWYTVAETAKILGVSRSTIYNRMKKIDTSSHTREIRTNENNLVLVFDEYVFRYVSIDPWEVKRTVAKNKFSLKHESDSTKAKQEKENLTGAKSGEKWYTAREMAEIVGIGYSGIEKRLKKIDTTSHKRYIRSKDNKTRIVIYDEYVLKLVSYPRLMGRHMRPKEVILKYEDEIEKLKQEVQREKNKRTECLEKYSKHLDYIVSIKNEYSAMQRQIADLTAENNELKAELARKPVWRKLFA